ncbi:MAG: GntR domain protein [Nocardioidaceae bacterium]|nr:GntR domain protein [Nocardioidaceae bacterium]
MSITPDSSLARQLRIPKASELIAAHLRRQIVQDELVEDQSLAPEATLMAEFNVSRPTLREAYRILESEGLLTVRRGAHGGARVHKPKPDGAARYAALVLQSQGALLSDVYDARLLLEGPVAEIVARTATPEDIALLTSINEEAALNSVDLVKTLAIHHKFHNTLMEMSNNMTLGLLSKMIDIILEQANFTHVRGRASEEDEALASKRAQRTHVKLVEHFEAGDVEAADELWRSHLAVSAKLVLTHSAARTALEVMN